MNRGTSLRSEGDPLGDLRKPQVRAANMMVSRCILLIYLLEAKGCTWSLEQPCSSCLYCHPRFQQMLADMRCYRVCLKMGDFGGPTAKPSLIYSNRRWQWEAIHEVHNLCVIYYRCVYVYIYNLYTHAFPPSFSATYVHTLYG